MKLDFKIQSEELNLAKLIDEEIAKKPKKMYVFIGTLKESGFDLLEESIIDTKIKLTLFMGIDKKNTTKALLDNILKYTKDVYVYNNNDIKEFESNICIFEFDKTAVIYLSSSNMSESGLTKDISVFTRIVYNLENENENKDYKSNSKMLLDLKKFNFVKLDKDIIKTFVDEKVIFSNKLYEHNVKSISEFLGKKEVKNAKEADSKENEKIDEDISSKDFNIPSFDLSNSNIDIDISDAIELESNVEEEKLEKKEQSKEIQKEKVKKSKEKKEVKEIIPDFKEDEEIDDKEFNDVVDLNDMLLTKSKVKLSVAKPENKEVEVKDEETITFKKLDLNNVSNYIFELPAKQANGQDSDMIKIPNYIRELIPNFFEFSENATTKTINGVQYKTRDIQVEIVDVKNNSKIFDKNAKMMQKKGQTYMTFTSKNMGDIEYSENDIARIIKLSSNIYHIEIISKDMQEYKIWSKIMNKKLKGVDRKYGIM